MQLAYLASIATNRNQYSTGRMQSTLTIDAYNLPPDDTYITDSDKLFTAEFWTCEPDGEINQEYQRKWWLTHPSNWAAPDCYGETPSKGVYFRFWRLEKLTIAFGFSHLSSHIESVTSSLAAMRKIESCIDQYNLVEKYERNDIVSTWFEALRILKFEQLIYSKERYRPVRNGLKKGTGHNVCFDRIN